MKSVHHRSKHAKETEVCVIDEFTSLLLLGGFLPTQDYEHAVGVDLVIEIFFLPWINSILMEIDSME